MTTPHPPETESPGTEAHEAEPPEAETPDPESERVEAPLLVLSEGLPPVTDTDEGLASAAAALAAGTGPIGVDAERASGYRYSNRAYLIQLRREGSGSWLIDPIPLTTMKPLADVLAGTEWILHAATQDLPCLAEVGLRPGSLFDTELAGRLLGYPRVGLGTLVEEVLGFHMKKEHSAADWSTRPLPEAWLEYAALDVEPLAELRTALAAELEETGKSEWARQEFEHLRSFVPAVRTDAWRRVSGMHKVRGRRSIAAVKELWETRDELARDRDVTPGRILPDSSLVLAASALPADRAELLAIKGFHGRGAERYASRWVAAIERALALPEEELPARSPRGDGPPVPRAWADKDPVAARRLELARAAIAEISERHRVPVENILTPDYLRRVLWTPPRTRSAGALLDEVAGQLAAYGARSWQIMLTAPVITDAILAAEE